MTWDATDYNELRDEMEDLREEEWREAHREGQLDDQIQITWMRRRRPAAIPVVSIDEFDQAMRSQHGHMFSTSPSPEG